MTDTDSPAPTVSAPPSAPTAMDPKHPTTSDSEPRGRAYWRSLSEHANSPALREQIAREFPQYDPDELLGMSRRKFMKLAGASMALAGLTLTGCRRWPSEEVLPHGVRPAGTLPGVPEHYASMVERGGVAYGTFVTSFDGRPIHVAGSPLHPDSGDAQRYAAGQLHGGAADAFTLASILEMYDPDRSRTVVRFDDDAGQGTPATLDAFVKAFDTAGPRIAVISEAQSGPASVAARQAFLKKFPQATWTTWEPLHRDSETQGAIDALGQPLRAHYDLSQAMVVASFDADLLGEHPAALRHARDWSKLRKACDQGRMSRVYATAPAFSTTSSNADVHLQARPTDIAAMLDGLARALELPGFNATPLLNDEKKAFIQRLAADLKQHRGASVVAVGPAQPASVHALALAINDFLGNLDQTVTLTQQPDGNARRVDDLYALTDRIKAGQVDAVLVLGGNPIFDAPADLGFAEALGSVRFKAHLGLYANETALACDWHVNRAHPLECWGDGRAWDGTICLQQPLILPLFGGLSTLELLARLTHDPVTAGRDLVRRAWGGSVTESGWRQALHDGLVADTAFPAVSASASNVKPTGVSTDDSDTLQLAFRRDPKVYDGRHANNGWLQELPEPTTKVTWDNPAWISVADAQRLGVENGDVVEIKTLGQELAIAVFIVPGQAPGTLVLTLGGGRRAAGRIGTGVGFNTYAVRTIGGQSAGGGFPTAKVTATARHHELATTEIHHLIDTQKLDPAWIPAIGTTERDGQGAAEAWAIDVRTGAPGKEGTLVKQASFAEYQRNPKFANDDAHGDVTLQLYDAPLAAEFAARAEKLKADHPEAVAEGWEPAVQFNDKHAWGMTIDMTACTGCSACVVACQSENNIPVVGKDQVMMSREMQWLRIDSYYRGDPTAVTSEKLDAVHMPVTCVHCENAPCEQVCPVAATVHDTEGLNTMVYNRCIGTRYCSNNCPYKVRRFNYFDYHSKLETDSFRNSGKPGGLSNKPWLKMPDQQQGEVIDQIRRMMFNPDVTVRMRGVMEKCTYCTQRIQRAKITAKADWAKDKTAGKDTADYPYVGDGGVVTACQAACPTEAITFGNLNDPASAVSKTSRGKRSYKLLEELNSRPRTKHMALVRNYPEA